MAHDAPSAALSITMPGMSPSDDGVWLLCSACRKGIGFGAIHWVCSVSTCNRSRTRLVFCSVACWDSHLSTLRHREAWAVEERAPTREDATAMTMAAASPRLVPPAPAPAPASPRPPLEGEEVHPRPLGHEHVRRGRRSAGRPRAQRVRRSHPRRRPRRPQDPARPRRAQGAALKPVRTDHSGTRQLIAGMTGNSHRYAPTVPNHHRGHDQREPHLRQHRARGLRADRRLPLNKPLAFMIFYR